MGTAEQPASDDLPDLKDVLEQNWDAAEGEPETEPEEAPEAEAEPTQEGQAEAEADEGESEEAPEESEGEGAEDEPDEEAIEPPQHWAEEDKKLFQGQPKETQEFLLRRHKEMEADYTRKTQEISDIKKAIEPYRQELDMQGVNEADAVRRLLAANRALSQDPAGTIQQLAQQHGVDLSQLVQSSEDEDEFADPEVKQLKQELQQLKQQREQDQQVSQQSQQQALLQEVERVKSQADESGNPKFPHWEQVENHMAALIQNGVVEGNSYAETLENAYEQAVWARPDLRQQLLEQQKQEAAEQSKQERTKKAQKAKQAASPKPSSGNAAPAEDQNLSLREQLEKHAPEYGL